MIAARAIFITAMLALAVVVTRALTTTAPVPVVLSTTVTATIAPALVVLVTTVAVPVALPVVRNVHGVVPMVVYEIDTLAAGSVLTAMLFPARA